MEGGWIQITQTLTPRVFAAARVDEQWTRWTGVTGENVAAPYRRLETGIGFRVTPEVTLRGTFMTRKGYVVDFWDDQFLASVVFAKKLW